MRHAQVLVGDPKQLPPTIGGSEATHERGLEYTLFERLADGGLAPVMLRTQYRCHPLISRIPCALFYGGRLVDGVSADDRDPLIDDLPTLCFYDVHSGQERKAASGSVYNMEEARFVVAVLTRLLEAGLEPPDIGVVTLYKAQADCIVGMLPNGAKGLLVSTVDAFQACVTAAAVVVVVEVEPPCG
jgi:superfamily I DNA and/or RNA helicase